MVNQIMNRKKRITIISVVILFALLIIFYYLDAIDIGKIVGSQFGENQEYVEKAFSSIKLAVVGVVSFLLGKVSDIIGLLKEFQARKKAETPSLTLEAGTPSLPRRQPLSGVEECISLGDEIECRFIECEITNQGDTDIPLILINGKSLSCDKMKKGDSYTVHLKLPASMVEASLDIRCQNEKNRDYSAQYQLNVDLKNNTSTITCTTDFEKGNKNGRHAKN